jgi:hypothetical protein
VKVDIPKEGASSGEKLKLMRIIGTKIRPACAPKHS